MKRLFSHAALAVALLSTASAEEKSSAAAAQEFRVGAGDVLQIDVWQEPGISGKFTVGNGGAIDHPLLGSFAVKGKTADEISAALRDALGNGFLKNPRLTVRVVEFKSFRVTVVGGVKQPGVLYLEDRGDAFSAVLKAGGFDGTPGAITVLRMRAGREQPEVLTADLSEFLRSGDVSQNPKLEPGDLVFVPGGSTAAASPKTGVTVVGEVKTPGVYDVGSGETVLSAVLKAGGPTEFASRNSTRVYRGTGKAMDVRLADVIDKGERKKDVSLEPGDLVVVPGRLF